MLTWRDQPGDVIRIAVRSETVAEAEDQDGGNSLNQKAMKEI